MQMHHLAITLGVVLGAASLVLGDGTIDTTNATLTIGDAPATGTLTVDPVAPLSRPPSLPQMPPLEDLGDFTGSMPALPDLGDGSDGDFLADTNATHAGGTLSYSSFAVDQGVTLEYTGAVTILCTGNATINGTVFSDTVGADIKLICGGTIEFGAGAMIDARAADSALLVEAGDDILGGRVVNMEGAAGLTLRAHGQDGETRKIDLTEGELLTHGDLLLQSHLTIDFDGVVINVHGDSFLAQSLAQQVKFRNVALTKWTNGDVLFESHLGVTVFGESAVEHKAAGSIRMRGFSGSVGITESNITVGSGALECLATTNLSVINSVLATPAGALTLQGEQILVSVLPPSGNSLAAGGADLTLRSATTVAIVGNTQMVATNGNLVIHARGDQMLFARDYQNAASPRLFGVGAEFRSGTKVSGRLDRVVVSAVDISAGSDGVNLDIDQFVNVSDGPLNVVAEGDIRLNGTFNSQGDLTVMSRGGDIDLASGPANLQAQGATNSADIRVESYAPTGTINAANATLQTATATESSGDISLIVHGAPPSAIQATRVAITPAGGRRPPSLTLRGVLDTGTGDVDLSGATTIRVGDYTIDIPSLTGARRLQHRTRSTVLSLTPRRDGSSRVTVSLRIRQDLTGLVDLDGHTTISLTGSGYGTSTTVVLAGGRFQLGRVPGTLLAPMAYLERASVRLRGGGRDTCRATFGYAAPATIPADPPDVTLSFADAMDTTITGDQFVKRGARFLFRSRDGPIRSIAVDPRRGRVILSAADMDFGTGDDGATELPFTVSVGAVTGTGAVRGARTARMLRY